MKPKGGLDMKILKSILNYIPLATFIIFVVTDGIISVSYTHLTLPTNSRV